MKIAYELHIANIQIYIFKGEFIMILINEDQLFESQCDAALSLLPLIEKCDIKFNGTDYKILSYRENELGKDPEHSVRLKVSPTAQAKNSNALISIAINPKYKAVDIDHCKINYKALNLNQVNAIKDLVGGLAQFDFDTIANFEENTKSEDAMQAMIKRFEGLPRSEQKAYIKAGRAAKDKLEASRRK